MPVRIERRQRREIAERRQLHAEEIGDEEEGIDLEQRDHHAGKQARHQQEPARQGRREQHAHRTHLAVVHHRQRALHALEQLDHREQARRDVHVVGDVGLVGRDDRDAERRAEACGKNDQPDQRPDERREKPLALLHEAQELAPDNAGEGAGVMHGVHAATSSSRLAADEQPEGAAEILGAGLGHHVLGGAARDDLAAIDDQEVVIGLDLVEQMRGPQHADIVASWRAHAHGGRWRAASDRSSPMVGSSRRSNFGLCKRDARDLDAAAMTAVQRAHPLADALRHVERLERRQHALVGVFALQSSERREIAQILLDREIEIERRLLEHDAERAERLRTPFGGRLAANLDTAFGRVEQPGDEREQRRLAGAVRPEQRRDLAGIDLEAHIVERLLGPVPIGDVLDGEDGGAGPVRPCRLLSAWAFSRTEGRAVAGATCRWSSILGLRDSAGSASFTTLAP